MSKDQGSSPRHGTRYRVHLGSQVVRLVLIAFLASSTLLAVGLGACRFATASSATAAADHHTTVRVCLLTRSRVALRNA